MNGSPVVSLVMPAYNEAASIEAALADVVAYFVQRGTPYELIVSADGNDGTREIASRMAERNPCITVIGSTERRGKGFGVRRGIELARGKFVGYMDADRNTRPVEIDKMLPLLEQGADVVIGSRAIGGSLFDRHRSLHRRIGSFGFRLITHLVTGLWEISDTQCGLKFFRSDVARRLFGAACVDGYSFDVELLFLARRAGYSITQVPVAYRDSGDTRMSLVRSNLQTLRDLLRIRLLHRGRAVCAANRGD